MAQNTANAFADAFKAFNPSQVDFNSFFSTSRRNFEAVTDANKMIAEGIQAVARRQTEIARSAAEDAIQFWKDLYSSRSPDASVSKVNEFIKESFESGLANAREIFEMISKSNTEAAEVISNRSAEALNELTKATNVSTGASSKK